MDRISGCIFGGAVGDALGAPLEFYKKYDISTLFGIDKVIKNILVKHPQLEITDDTQMSLYTMEGLNRDYSIKNMLHSYHRWLVTQKHIFNQTENSIYNNLSTEEIAKIISNSSLIKSKKLYKIRSPGNTCLEALSTGRIQTVELILNDSKGCGGVMRVAPVGFFFNDANSVYINACDIALLTHGHPSGYIPAGILATIIYYINNNESLVGSITKAMDIAYTHNGDETKESFYCITSAIKLALKGKVNSRETEDSIRSVYSENNAKYYTPKSRGIGWIAPEALAYAIYCSLIYNGDFLNSIETAINHSGDSDSIGAICGNILGAYLGRENINCEHIINVIDEKDIIESSIKLFKQELK